MTIIKWKTGTRGSVDIQRVECIRETDAYVWLMDSWNGKREERRVAKRSDWWHYHDSFDEAAEFLKNRALAEIETALSIIADAEKRIEKVRALARGEA